MEGSVADRTGSLFPRVPVLEGSLVRLEPLGAEHRSDLAEAAEEDRSTYNFTWVPRAEEVSGYIRTQIERARSAELVPFAQVRVEDGRAVGCTALCSPRPWPDRHQIGAVEIGYTWLAASAQRRGINVEAKLLLMSHVFERWNVARVDIKTDARNDRSRQAIAGLGAQFEGVLRSWSQSWAPGEAGRFRDSAMYSVVAAEWPSCERHLRARLLRAARSTQGAGGTGT